ncbi:MAG: hypothetical protein DRG83_14710 [Deltaproteobacteria bacterium]|nr:MAG: hypothetical protein DRG83_14710 [Deltaproteobacteria bacterium]
MIEIQPPIRILPCEHVTFWSELLLDKRVINFILPVDTSIWTARFAKDAKYAKKKNYCDLRVDNVHNYYTTWGVTTTNLVEFGWIC